MRLEKGGKPFAEGFPPPKFLQQQHFVQRSPGGYSGVHVFVALDDDVDDGRVRAGKRGAERGFKIFQLGDAVAFGPIGFGELHEVRLIRDVHGVEAASVEKILELADHAQTAVVQEQYLDRQLVADGGDEFLEVHLERAVAGHVDDELVGVECKLKDYNPETCILRGEIVNVSVDERVLDQNGKVDASKVIPVIFDPFNNDYLKVGEKVGNAFSDGKALK